MFSEVFVVVRHAYIGEKDRKSLFESVVSVGKFAKLLLRLCAALRQFFLRDAVNVRRGIMPIRGSADFAMRAIVANQRDSSGMRAWLAVQSYGKVFDEFQILPNEDLKLAVAGMNCRQD